MLLVCYVSEQNLNVPLDADRLLRLLGVSGKLSGFYYAVYMLKLTPDHLQSYLDLLSLGGEWPDGTDENVPIIPTISYEQFPELNEMLSKKKNPALLPIQIAYYTGLRIGEACSLTWRDIDLKEQRLTVRRSIRYNSARHRTEIGTTKRKKIRSVDFCNTLAEILKEAKKTQMLDRLACGPGKRLILAVMKIVSLPLFSCRSAISVTNLSAKQG